MKKPFPNEREAERGSLNAYLGSGWGENLRKDKRTSEPGPERIGSYNKQKPHSHKIPEL